MHSDLFFYATLAVALVWVLSLFVLVIVGKMAFARLKTLLPLTLLALLLLFFFQKYIEVSYPPFRTLFESLLFLALCIQLLQILTHYFLVFFWLDLTTALFQSGILIYASTQLHNEAGQLPAALQSPWFIPHVLVYFLGYAALFFSFAFSLIYLKKGNLELSFREYAQMSQKISLVRLIHFTTKLGFLFIVLGLIIGAFWAQEAWGDYWAWDPKENWALITVLLYSGYFHLKGREILSQKQLSWLLVLGFVAVIFTYLGMKYLPTADQSTHIYIEKRS